MRRALTHHLRSIVSPSVATLALSRAGYGSVGGIGAASMGLLLLLMRAGVVDAAPAAAPKHA